MYESAEISEQQHMSMDNINSEELNVSIDITETIAVDKDTGSNNKAGNNKTNNDNWSKEDPVIKTFLFVENTGLKTVVPENDAPFFFFKLLVSDEFLSELVQRSNDYALQVINSSHPLCRKSVLNKWKEVTLLEMKKFFGLVFHMGLVAMPSYRAYWSRSRLYKNDMFPSVMSRERFQSIMRFLHSGDKPQQPDDRLAKVRFLINHLNNTMPEIYTPHKELSLDESMMLWRGRLVFRQYIKNKRHKYGVKFFELCSDDGLVMKVQIYSGTKLTDTESLGQTGSIVLHLMEPYLDKGYHLFTNNWYNSVSLTEYMSKKNIYYWHLAT